MTRVICRVYPYDLMYSSVKPHQLCTEVMDFYLMRMFSILFDSIIQMVLVYYVLFQIFTAALTSLLGLDKQMRCVTLKQVLQALLLSYQKRLAGTSPARLTFGTTATIKCNLRRQQSAIL